MNKGLVGLFLCMAIFRLNAQDDLCVMFYNLENYFDCEHDSLKNDYAFLPEGDYHWTWSRFHKKTHRLASVLASVGNKTAPDVMGLSEIENEKVLMQLMKAANIESSHRYVYKESPDARGIDVCFVYNRYLFKVLSTENVRIHFTDQPQKQTREMMYVYGRLQDGRLLHFFICHWPSRYGGAMVSEPFRCCAAARLREKVDSIFLKQPQADIIIMGDFNDEPSDLSLKRYLRALPETTFPKGQSLYNLMWRMSLKEGIKTHKYQGHWSMFDQMIVSSHLYASANRSLSSGIVRKKFLLIPDEKYLGVKPFRTYSGYSYLGGYSDHLPIYLYLPLRKK